MNNNDDHSSSSPLEEEIIKLLGVSNPLDLFKQMIPREFILDHPSEFESISDEYNLIKHIKEILSKNKLYEPQKIYAGVDVEPTYVPAVVKYLISRGEFLTSYTPYQPEISQGVLQALFEYQSIISELTGMDVVNSSMYDWASAAAEALRMCIRVSKNNKILIPSSLPYNRKKVIYSYLSGASANILEYGYEQDGTINLDYIKELCTNGCAGLYTEYPNYYGYLNTDLENISELIHDKGGLVVVGVDLWSLPLLKPPGELGADIVVGEGQPMGIPMNYGGPLLGIFGVKGDYSIIRQMPGRIIGMTSTINDNETAFTMILQTREQHIRREKATSNICSNEALSAIQVAIFISYMGKSGLINTSLKMLKLSHKLRDGLINLGFKDLYNLPFFRRFTVIQENLDFKKLYKDLKKEGYLPGVIDHDKWIINVNMFHDSESVEKFLNKIEEVI